MWTVKIVLLLSEQVNSDRENQINLENDCGSDTIIALLHVTMCP